MRNPLHIFVDLQVYLAGSAGSSSFGFTRTFYLATSMVLPIVIFTMVMGFIFDPTIDRVKTAAFIVLGCLFEAYSILVYRKLSEKI